MSYLEKKIFENFENCQIRTEWFSQRPPASVGTANLAVSHPASSRVIIHLIISTIDFHNIVNLIVKLIIS